MRQRAAARARRARCRLQTGRPPSRARRSAPLHTLAGLSSATLSSTTIHMSNAFDRRVPRRKMMHVRHANTWTSGKRALLWRSGAKCSSRPTRLSSEDGWRICPASLVARVPGKLTADSFLFIFISFFSGGPVFRTRYRGTG